MAHLTRAIADTVLVRGYITTTQNLIDIDQKTFVSLNGDEGGTWSPTAPIIIAGTGVVIAGLWVMSGAGVSVTTGVSKPITFNKGTAGDYFGIDPSHAGYTPSTISNFFDYYAPVAQAVGWFGGLLPNQPGARFFTPLNVYSGASKIDNVVITWRVRESHAALPQYLPRARVVAVTDEGVVIPLRTKDATTDADGFQFLPTPASPSAYYNAHLPQTWTYTCNVVLPVDSAKYVYYIEFIEESGTNSWTSLGSQFISAVTHHSAVTIFDGRN